MVRFAVAILKEANAKLKTISGSKLDLDFKYLSKLTQDLSHDTVPLKFVLV